MALQFGSPAIDAGDNSVLSEAATGVDYNGDGDTADALTTDQRGAGFDRILNSIVDIGAYERIPSTQSEPDFVVNTDADSDDGSCDLLGQGAGNQDCTLREAINAANAVSDASGITFAADYTITLTSGRPLPAVTSDITITGNSQANTLLQASTCNPVTRPGGCTPATYAVLQVDAAGSLTLQDATVRYGSKPGSASCTILSCYGGGIYNGGGLTLTNVSLNDNYADLGGGLYTAAGSSAVLQSVTVSGNSAGTEGGAVYNHGGALTVTDSSISGNNSDNSSGNNGGGINLNGGGGGTTTASLTRVVFSGNSASGEGGGLYQVGGDPSTNKAVLTDVTFDGNVAGVSGGGVYTTGGSTLILNRATFRDNSANAATSVSTVGGGGMYTQSPGTNTLTNVTFSGNSTTSYGGELYISGTTPTTLTNLTFSGNSAPSGQGGGIFTATAVKLVNSIIANSTSGGDCYAYFGSLDVASSNNLVELNQLLRPDRWREREHRRVRPRPRPSGR